MKESTVTAVAGHNHRNVLIVLDRLKVEQRGGDKGVILGRDDHSGDGDSMQYMTRSASIVVISGILIPTVTGRITFVKLRNGLDPFQGGQVPSPGKALSLPFYPCLEV